MHPGPPSKWILLPNFQNESRSFPKLVEYKNGNDPNTVIPGAYEAVTYTHRHTSSFQLREQTAVTDDPFKRHEMNS